MKIEELLQGLNEEQKQAVQAIEGTVQINAISGSGKTAVLTRRIAYMIEQGISPSTILCTTFTKKASTEMEERLAKLIPKMTLQQISLGTSHSIGRRILSKEYKNINHHLAPAFNWGSRMLINGELKRFLEGVKKDMIMDRTIPFEVKEALRDTKLPVISKMISNAKDKGLDASEYIVENCNKTSAQTEMFMEFYKKYEDKKWAECRIDADDLLFLTVRLFKEYPEILKKYQSYYKYILVDEGQDNNSLQYEMFRMIAYPEFNLFLVGDDDQSIYSFRNARPDQFIHFRENYRNVNMISLQNNYRSNAEILETANRLIKHNKERIQKTMIPNKSGNENCVSYAEYVEEEDEARGVVDEIANLILNEGYSAKDMCILYRTNAQSRALEDELIMSQLPYVIHGGISFYERREVKDIIAYLSLIQDMTDDIAFERIINVPNRYLGKAFIRDLNSHNASHMEVLLSNQMTLKPYQRNSIEDFLDLYNHLKFMYEKGKTTTELVDYLLDEGGYKDYILDDEDEEDSSRLDNIETLKYLLSKNEKVDDFLSYARKMSSSIKTSVEGVQLMTIHRSKGLEFPVVFVIGSTEGSLPHFRAIQSASEGKPLAVEEERRLMYVAVTRAEQQVFVSATKTSNGNKTKISRFIYDMGLKKGKQ